MCGKHLQIAEVHSDRVYNNSLADEIKLYKEPCETPFPLLLSVIVFVPSYSWRRGIMMPQALGILVSAE